MNIAVTGGMGSGKSGVSQLLCEMLGGRLVSADRVCRDLLAVGHKGWKGLRAIAPPECFLADGQIDRPALRKAIFSDESFRKQVDAVLHPMVREELQDQCRRAVAQAVPFVAEIPLLFEKSWQDDFDCTLLVYASDEICAERIVKRDLVTKAEAMKSIGSQLPIQEKIALADYVVDNSTLFSETARQLEQLVGKGVFTRKASRDTKNT